MALSLNFNAYQSDDGKSIIFHETTGGSSSTTGWGYPVAAPTNPELTDVVSAGVTIESESNTNTTTTGTGATFTITVLAGALDTITIVNAGTGYYATQVCDVIAACTTIGTVTIDTVDTDGEILTLSITTAGTGYSNGSATLNCPINIITSFPDDTDDTQWNFQADDVYISGSVGDADDVIADGIYKLIYTVYDTSANEYQKTKYIFCDYSVRCCIRKLFAAISIAGCDCDSDVLCTAIKTRAYWRAIHNAVETGNYSRATAIYTLVYNICNQVTGCGC